MLRADPNNPTFQHEYGHYLQSQSYGWAYLLCVGLPSLKSVRNNPDEHKFQPFEVDANIRAYNYFNQYFEDAPKWNTNRYPLTMEPGTTVENKWWHYIVGFHLPWIEIPLAAAVGIYSPRVSSLTE